MGFTQGWGWPQWIVVVYLLMKLVFFTASHNKPKVRPDGEVQQYNAFVVAIMVAFTVFVLAAGGFF